MYVQMQYSDWAHTSRAFWFGLVGHSAEALNIYSSRGGTQEVVYSFMIDAVSGMRIDLSSINNTGRTDNVIDRELMIQFRTAPLMLEWWEMNTSEQMALLGITQYELDAYKEIALEIATRHFNNSEVVEISQNNQWSTFVIFPRLDDNGELALTLNSVNFTAVDDTGREAHIGIPAQSSLFASTQISTQHNDFIPDFNYGRPGLG